MKSTLMFVLFLGLLLVTLEKKPKSLVKRINNAFRMFAISEFVDEYEPSKYAKDLYNENADVNNLSIKIQLVKECIMSVLDFLKLDDATIQKVATAKVSNLMDAMDIFVAIAKEKKQPSILADLQKAFPDITTAEVWKGKLSNADNVKDAVEFIKDTIHADSVVNLSKRKQVKDEINESNSEEQFEDNEIDEKEKLDEEDENNTEVEEKNENEEKPEDKKSYRKRKYGNFYELKSVPSRKENVDEEEKKNTEEEKNENKDTEENQEKESNDDNENDSATNENEKLAQNESSQPIVAQSLRKAAYRTANGSNNIVPTKNNPRFLNSEQIKRIKQNGVKKNLNKRKSPHVVSQAPEHEHSEHNKVIEPPIIAEKAIDNQSTPEIDDDEETVAVESLEKSTSAERKEPALAHSQHNNSIEESNEPIYRKSKINQTHVSSKKESKPVKNEADEDNFEEDSDNDSDELEEN